MEPLPSRRRSSPAFIAFGVLCIVAAVGVGVATASLLADPDEAPGEGSAATVSLSPQPDDLLSATETAPAGAETPAPTTTPEAATSATTASEVPVSTCPEAAPAELSDTPGVAPPSVALGSPDGPWAPGDAGSFMVGRRGGGRPRPVLPVEALGDCLDTERRDADLHRSAGGVPADRVARRLVPPWERWDLAPGSSVPPDLESTMIDGQAPDGTPVVCLDAPTEATEYSVRVQLHFQTHGSATCYWHLVRK